MATRGLLGQLQTTAELPLGAVGNRELTTSRPSQAIEFCQYYDPKTGLRCVSGYGHYSSKNDDGTEDGHDLMPRSSASVQAIERRETVIRRLGDDEPITPTKLAEKIDEAIGETSD